MANLISTNVTTYAGKQTYDYFIKPLFVGIDPRLQGITVMPDVQSDKKLNYFSSVSKQTKAYSKGFTGINGSTLTQRTLTVVQLKNEIAQDANVFYETIYQEVQKKGWEWNTVQGTMLEGLIMELFRKGIESDIYRLFWLADKSAETLSSSTYGTATGTADTRYNMFDGTWELVFDNAATSPTATQIKRVDLNSTDYLTTAAVAQVTNCTPSLASGGSAGGGNIKIDGVDYDITWDTSVKVTVEAFVSDHATALAARHIVATEDDSKLILTSAIAGRPFSAAYTADSGSDLLVAIAAGKANVAPSDLADDKAFAAFKAVYKAQPATLKNVPNNQKVFHVDYDTYENYLSTLEEDGKYTDMAKVMIMDGVERLAYRGIQIIPHQWEQYLEDTPRASASVNPARKTRIMLTRPENLVLGVDGRGDEFKFQFWHNPDQQEDRFRAQFRMGVQYVENTDMVVAY